jgi:hypothetical protein
VNTANHAPGGPISVAVSMTATASNINMGHGRSSTASMLFAPTLSLETIQISPPPTNNGTHKTLVSNASTLLQQYYPDAVVTSSWCLEGGGGEVCSPFSKVRRYYTIVKDGMDHDNASKRLLMHLGDE